MWVLTGWRIRELLAKGSEGINYAKGGDDSPALALTHQHLQDALTFIAPDQDQDQLDTEVVFLWKPDAFICPDTGELRRAGIYVGLSEYPEDGSIYLGPASSARADPQTCQHDNHSFFDIDLHRYRCSGCGKIFYYSGAARAYYEEGTPSCLLGLGL